MSDITTQSLTSLVKNIKNKKLSSEEVTQAFVDRSEKSKELNAYITEDFSNAINKAKKFDQNPNLDLKLRRGGAWGMHPIHPADNLRYPPNRRQSRSNRAYVPTPLPS